MVVTVKRVKAPASDHRDPPQVTGELVETLIAVLQEAKRQLYLPSDTDGYQQALVAVKSVHESLENALSHDTRLAEDEKAEQGGSPMARPLPKNVLGTLDLSVGSIDSSDGSAPVIRIQPFRRWYPEIEAIISEINREIADGSPILDLDGTLHPFQPPFTDTKIRALNELVEARSHGRLHVLPVAEQIRALFRATG